MPTASRTPAAPEETVWRGGPSQMTNLMMFTFSVVAVGVLVALPVMFTPVPWWVACFAVLPLGFAAFHWWCVRSLVFTLTTERLRIESGILTRRTEDLELYRVKDISMSRPIALRLVGLGHVVLTTSDHTTPQVTLNAIARPRDVLDLVRAQVERQRDRKRVTEVDFT